MQTIELEQILKTTLSKYHRQAALQQIGFNVFDDRVNYILISADIPKLTSLLHTIMKPTLDHTGASNIIFSTRQLLRTRNEILLEFSLEHNGFPVGISRFAYYRSLITSRRLIEELNGMSEFQVSKGHGTLLKFIIRFQFSHPTAQQAGPCSQTIRNKKILIVEDDEQNQQSIAHMLETEGISFSIAANGREAIETLEKESFDLILMDLHMPRMDGYQTTNFIRKQLNNNIPIIGMSVGNNCEDHFKCFEAGVNQFIKKPFTPELLLAQMCSFFEPVYLDFDLSRRA